MPSFPHIIVGSQFHRGLIDYQFFLLQLGILKRKQISNVRIGWMEHPVEVEKQALSQWAGGVWKMSKRHSKLGMLPNPRHGSANRFRKYMLDRGYIISVAYADHVHLAHGLHETLNPDTAHGLPLAIWRDFKLFNQWWKPFGAVPKV